MDLMLRIIRIVFSPRDEWQRIAGEGGHAALTDTLVLSLLPTFASFINLQLDAAQFVAIALVLAIVASTLGGGAAGALGLL
jgi:hypothetical protein